MPGSNSPFAKSILEVLDDAPEDELNISRIVDRVREQVAANSNQIPEGYPIQGVGHGWGEYIFRKKSFIDFIPPDNITTEEKKLQEPIPKMPGRPIREKSPAKRRKKQILRWISVAGSIVSLIGLCIAFFPKSAPPPMQLTVFVHDLLGKVVLENTGKLSIPLGNRVLSSTIGDRGRTLFADIPAKYKGDTLHISLDAKGWEIIQYSHPFIFTGEPIHLVVEQDPGLAGIRGIVRSEDTQALITGALVIINNTYTVNTDDMGRFSYTIPSVNISDRYELSVGKDGYVNKSLYYYPGSGPVDVRLHRK